MGGARYDRPLDPTSGKKFRALKLLGEVFVIGFSRNLRLRSFTEHAHFYLLPKLPLAVLRYLEILVLGQCLTWWLIFRHGVRLFVSQSPYEGFVVALVKRFASFLGYKVALVVEIHGDFEKSLFMQRRLRFVGVYRFVMDSAARFSLRQADLLRAVSKSTREQLERWAPGKTIIQFPAWTDIDAFLSAGAHRESAARPSNILYAGVLTPLKGVHHLIHAFASIEKGFPNTRLLIVGHEENKGYAEELKRWARRAGLDGRVTFMPAMPQAELAGRMARSCMLVLPSASEGLGRVIIEAMATGTPVIGSRVGGIPEIIKEGTTGFLVTPGDENGMAEKIRWILEHPTQARAMGCRARAFASQFFSTQGYVNGYRRVFAAAQPWRESEEHAASTF
jgi:glycosyltransferase involved in cell wall biosynthesis